MTCDQNHQQTLATFNEVAEKYWEKFKDFQPYQPSYDWFIQHLPKGKIDLLEIACGPGNVSRYLLNKKPNIKLLGIDLAPKMIELAQRHNTDAEFQIMDCRQISTLSTKFGAIMCGFCVPYLPWKDCEQLLKDISSQLLPKGIFYLSLTKGDQADEGFKGSNTTAGTIYVYYHSIKKIMAQLAQLQMKIIGTQEISHMHNALKTDDVFILAQKIS